LKLSPEVRRIDVVLDLLGHCRTFSGTFIQEIYGKA
jgi:hypothetical protein